MSEKKREEKDGFDIFQETCINCIEEVAKLVPQYTQSATNLQDEYTNTCKKMTESSIMVAKEFADATWGPGRFPTTLVKNASDVAEAFVKIAVLNNKAVVAALDAATQNIRLFNDNVETFSKLNLNLIRTWQSLYIPPRQ